MSWTPQEKPKETCPICAHPPHGSRQCFALGVSSPCQCAPGVTSKDQLDELWIERNAGRIPSKDAAMTREEQRAQKAAARDALRARVAGITADEARHLAEEVREATFSDPQARIRVLEALERLGITFPPGFK